MGVIQFLSDKLVNLVANLGTDRDKASASQYAPVLLTDEQLANAYRGAWLPRKIVDVPALDATRKWRSWQADRKAIEAIEAEEKRLGLQAKVKEALIKSRLFGGAAIYIGTGERDPAEPLNPERVRRGQLYLAVVARRALSPTEIERDVEDPRYGKPKAYRMTGGQGTSVEIHPSRLAIFTGAELPDQDLAAGTNFGWGDSVLQSVLETIKQSDGTMANVASLVFEAKVDVIRIPNLMDNLNSGGKEYEKALLNRLRLAALGKSINGMLLTDKEEEYESKSAQFGGLPDLMDRFLQAVAGAADIPATRLLGQSPAGLNSSGESDLRNYYDRVAAIQSLEIGPAMEVLDECLIRSALGARPPEIYSTWRPLWQPTAAEKSNIGKTVAETVNVIKGTGLFSDGALAKAAATALVENDVLPGLETALADEAGDEDEDEAGNTALNVRPAQVQDAAPRTLYVSRKVTNAEAILAWARAQGFETTVAADDLHVTVAYSRAAVDWMKVAESWSGSTLSVPEGGPRLVEQFDGGAVVLLFNSSDLRWRHEAFMEAGASWDWPDYQPHITFTYEPGAVDLAAVEPYRGPIELGPEIFQEVDEGYKARATTE